MNTDNSRGTKALKAGVWYTISNIATKAIMVLTTPIFTRIMTQEEYGISATFTSWYTLLVTFCTLNLTYSIGRAKLDFRDQLDEYVGNMQITALIPSVLLGIIGILFADVFVHVLELPIELIHILLIYLMAAPTIALYQAKFKYQYDYKRNIFITLYTTIFSVVLSLVFMYVMPEKRYIGRVWGIVIPSVVLSGILWINAAGKRWLKPDLTKIKYGLRIALPLVLNGISLNIMAQSDRVVITKYCGREMTAVYTIAYQIAILVSLVLDSIGQAWLPWFHDTYAAGDYARIRKNLKSLILFGCFIGLGCIAVAPEAIWILGGDGYMMGQWVVAPVVLGLVSKFIYANYEHIELHLKKTKYIGIGTAGAAIINVVLNIIFVPKYGFVAAGYTTCFSYFVLFILHYCITKFALKVDIYDHKFMCAAILVEAVCAGLILLLYQKMLIRYLVIAGMVFVMFIMNRDKIAGIAAKFSKKKA